MSLRPTTESQGASAFKLGDCSHLMPELNVELLY